MNISIRWGPQGCQPAREVSHRARSNYRHMVQGPARGKRHALLLVPACVLREIFVLQLICLSLREPRIVTYSPPACPSLYTFVTEAMADATAIISA